MADGGQLGKEADQAQVGDPEVVVSRPRKTDTKPLGIVERNRLARQEKWAVKSGK